MAKKKVVSNVYDSSDEGQSDLEREFSGISTKSNSIDYIDQLHKRADKTSYSISYILTDISNRILLSNEITSKYNKIKDPLQVKIGILKSKEFLYQDALRGIESLDSNIKKHSDFIQILKSLNPKPTNITSLINEQRKELDQAQNTYQEWIQKNIEQKILEMHSADPKNILGEVLNLYTKSKETITKELQKVENLQKQRDDLNIILKGAFPFSTKKLSLSFIKEYQNKIGNKINEDKIVKRLTEFRDQLPFFESKPSSINDYSYSNKLCELLNVNIKFLQSKTYSKDTLRSLANKIDSIIGRAPTAKDIQEYIRLNAEKLSKDNNFCKLESDQDKIKHIKATVNDYLVSNASEIYKILEETAIYATDPDYLQELNKGADKQDFLVQVRAYRKLHRDLEKVVLLSGDEGKRNIPPGVNTTIDITSGGTASLMLGTLESYKSIGERLSETLKYYQNFITTGTIHEKEKEFKLLSQIEAIRNTSALLTNVMFFELAESEFSSVQILANNKQYNFQNIDEQMPMAMKGALSGSVYLDMEFNEILTGKLPYDYRKDGDAANGEILNNRNKNILFDYLSYKMGIKNILDEVNKYKLFQNDILVDDKKWQVVVEYKSPKKNTCDQLKLNSDEDGYEIILKRATPLVRDIAQYVTDKLLTNIKGKISIKDNSVIEYSITKENQEYILKHKDKELLKFTAEIGTDGLINLKITMTYTTKYDELTKDFCLIQINSFPLSVFNELTDKFYGIKLPYLENSVLNNITLKAAAEPKDPDIDRKDDEKEAVLAIETNQDYACITRNSEDLHDVDKKDCTDSKYIELAQDEYYQPILGGCIEVEITA